MTGLEVGANFFNLLSVWFSSRNDVNTWWCGIVGCALYTFLFFGVRLYADVTLQLFFIASCIAGWWHWKRDGDVARDLPITRVTAPVALAMTGAAVAAAAAYGGLLHRLTDAANPFVDSAVLMLSVLAQLLLVARKIETWAVWFVVDCIAVPLYASKGLWLTAAVYAFFLVLVVMGWVRWKRLIAADEVAG